MPYLLAQQDGRRQNMASGKRKIGLRSIIIIVALHVLLWCSAVAIAAAALMLRDPADSTVSGSAIIILISGGTSILYVLLHTHFSIRRKLGKIDDPAAPAFQHPVYIGVRLAGLVALLWLICSGWAIIVTVKSPTCNLQSDDATVLLSCSCQKAGAACSVLLLIITCILFGLIQATENPFDNSLFGKVNFEPVYEEKEDNVPPYTSVSSLQRPPTSYSPYMDWEGSTRGPTPTSSLYKGKQQVLSLSQLSISGVAPPGSGYFASRSNVSLVDPHRLRHSTSASSLHLAHPRPVRRIPSASHLMRANNGSMIGHHYRNGSAGSNYSSRPSSRASSYTELPTFVSAISSVTIPAPSVWKAIHPPTQHLYHSSSLHSLRSAGNSSMASLSVIKQHGTRARTSPSSSSSSGGSPQAASWAQYRHRRANSSQSSATSGSSKLGIVEEEERPRPQPVQQDVLAMWGRREASPPQASRKGKEPVRYRERSASPQSTATPRQVGTNSAFPNAKASAPSDIVAQREAGARHRNVSPEKKGEKGPRTKLQKAEATSFSEPERHVRGKQMKS